MRWEKRNLGKREVYRLYDVEKIKVVSRAFFEE